MKKDMIREEAGERSNWPHKIVRNIIGEKKEKEYEEEEVE